MMDNNEINCTLEKLKSTSNSVIYDSLFVIRQDLALSQRLVKIIRERHALKDLVNFVHKPNERILDITLSILGNCCLEYESRIEVAKHGIVRPLVAVLHNLGRDSIQGRTCRLIGNLAQSYNIAAELHEKDVVSGLIVAIEMKGNSSATRNMAVRALRLLWSVQDQRSNMLELNAVHKVTSLLSTPYERKEDKDLLNSVVKALVVFSYDCSEQCARQICAGSSDMQYLVSLLTKNNLKYSIILCISQLSHNANARIVLGIADVVEVVVKELSNQDVSNIAISDSQIPLLSTLCLFSRESVNRSKIRRAGGLPIILAILRDCPLTILKSRAIHALAHFLYDELSLQELLKEGMVKVLVSRLGEFVKKYGKVHEERTAQCKRVRSNKTEHSSSENEQVLAINKDDHHITCSNPKRFRVSSPSYVAVLQQKEKYCDQNSLSPKNSVCNGGNLEQYTPSSPTKSSNHHQITKKPKEKYYDQNSLSPKNSLCNGGNFEQYTPSSPTKSWSMDNIEWSPSSCSSQFSPDASSLWPIFSLSEASSPTSYISTEYDWPELYSPVCQEEDDMNECLFEETNCIDPDEDILELPVDPLKPKSFETLNDTTDEGLALNLLSRISHMETPVEDLAIHTTLITLLDYISLLQNPLPRAIRVLQRIVRNYHYFLKIISHQFVLSVHSRLCRPVHHQCLQCKKLSDLGYALLEQISMVSATGFGEGELSYHILKPDESVRTVLAITIPYIVKRPRLLNKLLIECRGLDILEQIMEKRLAVFSEHVPTCLILLARALKITSSLPDTSDEHKTSVTWYTVQSVAEHIAEDEGDNIVLILDDESTMATSKTFLCSHSPVFEAMLQGNFKESKQSSVQLHAISATALLYLLYVMKVGKIPYCLPDLNLSTAVELLSSLDKFLIPGCVELTELILRQFLRPNTVCDIYKHMHYMGTLSHGDHIRMKSIEYILAAEMTSKQRANIFSELLPASYCNRIFNEMFDLVRHRLIIS